ncbi:hypothetical protein, partial [Actinomadura roseirufa]|uniref:hypothetical protein n=1 Tax=Actinomadura roseirufa TaxID=2094049 RepID=UPI001A955413
MLMRWMERALEGRSGPARLLALVALGLGDLLLLHRPQDAADRLLALAGFAICAAAYLAPRAAPPAVPAPAVSGVA